MKRTISTLCALTIVVSISAANIVDDYFKKCRQSNSNDYAMENTIVADFTTAKLLKALNPYYSDTTLFIRQQACYLTYKKGLQNKKGENTAIVSRLVNGLNDKDNGLRGTIIGYLHNFSPAEFNAEAKTLITNQLKNPHRPHYGELALLAGFIGVGRDELQLQLTQAELPAHIKWNIALALARMGNKEQLNYCVNKVKQAPVNSAMVQYLLPDLVYTRQKAALDYCVELLYSDKKLCLTANPDLSENILCAYPIIELIAPVIVDFPAEIDAGIGITISDYEQMLHMLRDWFNVNKNYTIRTDIY